MPVESEPVLKTPKSARRIAAWSLTCYSLVVLLIVAWPTPVDAPASRTLVAVLKAIHSQHVLMFIDYRQVEFSANVLMFAPVGLLVGILFGHRRWGFAVLVGLGVSTVIELCQFFFLPGRYGTVDDVIANTLGALLGALVARELLRRISSQRATERSDDASAPEHPPA